MADSRDDIDINLIKAFEQRSRADLHSANSLLKSGDYADAAYHAQQCAEKIVKCILILNNQFERTHLTSGIFEECISLLDDKNEWKNKLNDAVEEVRRLEKHWILPRYPEPYNEDVWNPIEEYTKKDAEEAIEKAKFVLDTLTGFMKEVHGIEF
ncbi:hypothetical protein BEH94_05610 [Candidatus Altiarchaeales archaeon WOR_SM1_SCG]|nr:hypothetical protein BEH94_05610 [Candidatus Altiarchaeales archaeon WOR_SM1_SCG]